MLDAARVARSMGKLKRDGPPYGYHVNCFPLKYPLPSYYKSQSPAILDSKMNFVVFS